MPRYPKNHKDAEYHVAGRKRRIAGSTVATRDFLAVVHEEHPSATITQLYGIITDRTRYIRSPEAEEVLAAHIAAGYGDHIPYWRY